MRPSDIEYKFKRAEHGIETAKLAVEQIADIVDATRLAALNEALSLAHTHLSMAHTVWERHHMSHRHFHSEYDL